MYAKTNKKKAKILFALGSALQLVSFYENINLVKNICAIALLEQYLQKRNIRNTIISEHKNWKKCVKERVADTNKKKKHPTYI